MKNILDGTRVLDFGRYIAGPHCAMLLADLGAEVIRIEKLAGSEDRYLCPIGEGESGEASVGALYLQLNRNKKGMTLNPTKPEGKEVIRRLVATADIVIANLPDPALATMGLDYESLVSIKPDIILTKMSAYGSTGPYREKLGFDGTGQSMSGAMYLSGNGEEPMRAYTPWVDHGTAMAAAFGTVAALLSKEKTGRGQVVEGSLLGTALAFQADALIEQSVTGLNRQATGNRSQKGGPSDTYKCKDGQWLTIQIQGEAMFSRWCELMGESKWQQDPRFADDVLRAENGQQLSARMAKWCADFTAAEIIEILEQRAMPCAPVYSPEQALQDPHIQQGSFMSESEYPGVSNTVPLVRMPVQFSEYSTDVQHRAPTLGEHTAEVMKELGYSEEEVVQLRAIRVV